LTLDQAVVGGLLVRTAKLTRGVFDACQAEESEAHLALSRCAAETSVTLVWLVEHGTEKSFKRFRADSFAYWRQALDRMAAERDADDVQRITEDKVRAHIEAELAAAGVEWGDVPKRTNSWGPDMRQRCEALGQDWLYDSLFASHSSYVHPSWHEIRAFHLQTSRGRIQLDPTFGGMAPTTAYALASTIASSCRAAATYLPCDLSEDDVDEWAAKTIRATRILFVEFSDFIARDGMDRDLQRNATHSGTCVDGGEPPSEDIRWSRTVAGSGDHPWADALIAQFDAAKEKRACEHLQQDPDQAAIWLAMAPELLSCTRPACQLLVTRVIEQRLGHALADEPGRCSVCGGGPPVRGASISSGSLLLRGMACDGCAEQFRDG